MELLPNSVEDFTSSEYWTDFFRRYEGEDGRAFEWYGSYEALRDLLVGSLGTGGCMSGQDRRILHVGCGNSALPARLHDEGFVNITNIDFSSRVIDLMREKNKSRRGLEWVCMDIEREFGEYVERAENLGRFDAIIDKGFLDAYLSDGVSEGGSSSRDKAAKYLASSMRLLAPGGKYILVTLGQEYMAKALAMGLYDKSLEIVVEPLVEIRDSKFLPYYIEMVNRGGDLSSRGPGGAFFRFRGAGAEEACGSGSHSIWTLARRLKELSAIHWNSRHVGDFAPGEIKEYQLSGKEPRNSFFITVYDTVGKRRHRELTVGLLVPLGEEQDWLYSTRRGFEEICGQAKCKRLIVISRFYSDAEDVSWRSEQEVLDEFSRYISPLALRGSGRFPILTVGGERSLDKRCVFSCDSRHCRQILVYDISESGLERRQMIFKSNPRLIQSEVVIRRRDGSGEPEIDYFSGLSNYYVGVVLVSSLILDGEGPVGRRSALILGLGGGVLASILRKLYPSSRLAISAVEIDQSVRDVAREYFGFSEKDVQVIIGDALEHVGSCDPVDCIIVDINSGSVNDSLMCPGAEFLSREFVGKLLLSTTRDGCIIYNVSCRDSERREELFAELGAWVAGTEGGDSGTPGGLLLQAIETGEDEINELWVIKKETRDNADRVRSFIAEKQLFADGPEETPSESCSKGDLWIKRFAGLK